MNTKTRIELSDSTEDVLSKLSDNNIGALSVLIQVIKNCNAVDPDAFGGFDGAGLMTLLDFDSHGIYGESIWVLHEDICGQNITNLLGVLRAMQLGIIGERKVLDDINARKVGDRSKAINVSDLVAKVRERLPKFGQVEA